MYSTCESSCDTWNIKERGASNEDEGLRCLGKLDINWIYNYCKQKIVIQAETEFNCTKDKNNEFRALALYRNRNGVSTSSAAVATETQVSTPDDKLKETRKEKSDKLEKVVLPTNESSESLLRIRHTCAHVMAMAVQKLFPDAKVTIGPWIENGFYYDFDMEPLTDKELKRIKKEMDRIIGRNLPLIREEVSRDEAQRRITALNEPYKLEILDSIKEDPITIYHIGNEWWDLCAGPHVEYTGKINRKAVELESIAGAYWRGDEKKPMLQRIYGTAWESEDQLKAYLHFKEEAKRRDHRRLGQVLDLFSIQNDAGGGFSVLASKGCYCEALYRYELSGSLHGLFRVRGFTQDDAHIFCLEDQIKDEIRGVLDLTEELLLQFGFSKYEVNLSTRPEKSVGDDDIWVKATSALRDALDDKGWSYQIDDGGGAFYGPKIDLKIEDALGRKWQCSTIQVDFNLPQRFDITYVDSNSEKKRPIMIHRAVLGSLERFFGVLIEHYAGDFPLWLSPVQAHVLPVTDTQLDYCKEVTNKLKANGIRSELCHGERLPKLIRNSEMLKIPLMAVVGAKEIETGTVTAINSAWKEACASTTPSTVVIAKGNYMAGPVKFQGPCKAPVSVRVEGILQASAEPEKLKSQDGWVVFRNIDGLTVSGGGTFDGQGSIAWSKNDCAKTGKCNSLPINIRFIGLTNSHIQDITSLNSKLFHINVLNCKNVTLQHVIMTAPGKSLNTDGIHIGRSSNINITGAEIKTGDDCVSLGDGSQQINIEKVKCGPGHGISIGSLGRYHDEQPVTGVTVRNCTISNTSNGVRVKTWPASPNGMASYLHFEDIIMENVKTSPILIDQEYCPNGQCQAKIPSKVKISNVSFKNIRGTSADPVVVKLACSKGIPCQNVQISDIHLTYIGKNGVATSVCTNVKPTMTGQIFPPACAKTAALR
ncbi:exopolygalacturonase clone GBGA483-like [Prunus yedoensis var. nudiflora]|uniref:threonine--tRNA ligase n=1 Tax=Prunus yedoensis var. nudiflora TaxID=2094558 RepID=A0A314YQL9_PRUYE|nr:exopolygalacturonase clone GBGA483-like [Prunus yedoensis var. nudiflora]